MANTFTWGDFVKKVPEIQVNCYGKGEVCGCAVHVYAHKRQMNLIDTFTDLPMEVCLIDTDDEEVKIFRCHQGITDYNRPFYIAKFTDIINRGPYNRIAAM